MGNLCGCGTEEEISPELQSLNEREVKLKNGYYVHSFDRFGDDFCELILSYLSFEHKLKFECVSKQWQRTIFNKQYHLDVDKCIHFCYQRNHNNNRKHARESMKLHYFMLEECGLYECGLCDFKFIDWFENLTKKCAFITRVSLCLDRYSMNDNNVRKSKLIIESLLNTIAINCQNITSLRLRFEILRAVRISVWQHFFEKCGKSLKHFVIVQRVILNYSNDLIDNQIIDHLFRLCPNLSTVSPISLNQLNNENNKSIILTKMREIKLLFRSDDRIDLMDMFTKRCGNSLNKLCVVFNKSLAKNQCSQYMSRISCLTQLESLEIISDCDFEQFGENMQQIGIKCTKIVSLKLELWSHTSNIDWNISLKNFINLRCFELICYGSNQISSDSLKNCQKLTHLSIRINHTIFAANIHQYLPQIKVIKISEWRLLCKQLLESLSKLPNLKVLEVNDCSLIDNRYDEYDSLIAFALNNPYVTVNVYSWVKFSSNLCNYEKKKFQSLNAPKNLILKFL